VAELSLATAAQGGSVVVAVSGELDLTTSKQFDECLSKARASSDRLILDLSGLDFIDTTCLSIIVGHWREQTQAGGSLVLTGARYDYARALWITGVAQRLPMYDNVAEALSASPSE
jgi:anti-sigma B factor antagonist